MMNRLLIGGLAALIAVPGAAAITNNTVAATSADEEIIVVDDSSTDTTVVETTVVDTTAPETTVPETTVPETTVVETTVVETTVAAASSAKEVTQTVPIRLGLSYRAACAPDSTNTWVIRYLAGGSPGATIDFELKNGPGLHNGSLTATAGSTAVIDTTRAATEAKLRWDDGLGNEKLNTTPAGEDLTTGDCAPDVEPVKLGLTYNQDCAPDTTNTWRVRYVSGGTPGADIEFTLTNAPDTYTGTVNATPGTETRIEANRADTTAKLTWFNGDTNKQTVKASGPDLTTDTAPDKCAPAAAPVKLGLTYNQDCAPDTTNTWRVRYVSGGSTGDRVDFALNRTDGTDTTTGTFTVGGPEVILEMQRATPGTTKLIWADGDTTKAAGPDLTTDTAPDKCAPAVDPVERLNLTFMQDCETDNPVANWRITNPNQIDVDYTITKYGTGVVESGTATPGDNFFERPFGAETLILTWHDETGATQTKTKAGGDTFSTDTDKCEPTEPPTTEPEITEPEITEPEITVAAFGPACLSDLPYIDYDIQVVGTDADDATITFLDLDGNQVAQYTDVPLSGQVVYPGASVDPVDFPGYELNDDGFWEIDPSDARLRDGLTVQVDVNPAAFASVSYPGATSSCNSPTPLAPGATEPEPTDPTTTASTVNGFSATRSTGTLPKTGTGLEGQVTLALVLLLGGVGGLFVARRRTLAN